MKVNLVKQDGLVCLKSLPSESVNLLFTDPPYGTSRDEFAGSSGTKRKADGLCILHSDRPYIEYIKDILVEAKRVLKPDGSIIMFQGKQYIYETMHACPELLFVDLIVYVQGMRQHLAKTHLASAWTPILWFAKSKDYYSDAQSLRKYFKKEALGPKASIPDVWEDTRGMVQKYYSQKPLTICRMVCELACPKDGLIVDPFLGSGTAAEAAHLTGRRFIGCDVGDQAITATKLRLAKYL